MREPPANPIVGAGPGRPKGSRNKLGRAARESIALVFEQLGGVKSLKEWAEKSEENTTIFYSKIYPRLIPYQVTGEDGDPLKHAIAVHFI